MDPITKYWIEKTAQINMRNKKRMVGAAIRGEPQPIKMVPELSPAETAKRKSVVSAIRGEPPKPAKVPVMIAQN